MTCCIQHLPTLNPVNITTSSFFKFQTILMYFTYVFFPSSMSSQLKSFFWAFTFWICTFTARIGSWYYLACSPAPVLPHSDSSLQGFWPQHHSLFTTNPVLFHVPLLQSYPYSFNPVFLFTKTTDRRFTLA